MWSRPEIAEPRLTVATAVPEGTTAVEIDVSIKRDQYVHAAVYFIAAGQRVLAHPVVRCGLKVWRAFLLPAARSYSATLGLPCTVREVPRPATSAADTRSAGRAGRRP